MNTFKYIIYVYIFIINLSTVYSECDRDTPFNRNEICSSNICSENEECFIDNKIIKTQWLNNIIVFNEKNFRAGNFAINSEGDMIIEYSKNNTRLFYGLKQNGKYYFKDNNDNEIPTKKVIFNDGNRFESKNIFISLENDDTINKQYLFSVSSYISVTELHDFENYKNDNYIVKSTSELFGNIIFSYSYCLLELPNINDKKYLLIYTYTTSNIGGNSMDLIRFSLSQKDWTYFQMEKKTLDNYYNRVVSSFILNSFIILFYVDRDAKYTINIYDFNFEQKGEKMKLDQIQDPQNTYAGNGYFFKCIHLKDDLGIFIYYTGINNYHPKLLIGNINIESFSLIIKINKYIDQYDFQTTILLNDLIKINDNRFSFITFIKDNPTILYILLFDLYNNDNNLKIRIYKLNLYKYKMITEFTSTIYNNYLVFTSTVISTSSSSKEDYFSILMTFGYANGTDFTINIYEYLMENDENNIFDILIENITIDNNIFGYEIIKDKIKLISIPDEIIIYNKNNIELKLSNDSILYKDNIIKQNKELSKTDRYYILEYQFIIQEPEYDIFNKYPINIINISITDESFEDQNNFFNRNIFYGRINSLKFKLCYEFCASCNILGNSINDQKCTSCLDDYQYDYPKISLPNCVPKKYYKKTENEILECNRDNSKFYFDIKKNKTICFKNDLLCPSDYPFLINSTYECKESCTYDELYSKDCIISAINEIIYKELKEDVIKTYPYDGESLVIEGEEEYVFQLTTSLNEIYSLEGIKANGYNLSMIDLSDCEELLKTTNGINPNTPLIILKFEKLTNIASKKIIQYEIFNPNNKTKLDLSICQNNPVNIYIPIIISEKTQNLYKDLAESGYNLFNINDSFYQDICTPYKSENGTDVLLSDRKIDFYSENETKCQVNCNYSNYNFESKYLKCECSVINENIITKDIEKFNGKMILTSFYDTLKYSNFKVLKCYKLIFTINVISKNAGSETIILFFVLYLICLGFFIFKGISPIKIDTIKTLFEKKRSKENYNNNKRNNFNRNGDKHLSSKSNKKEEDNNTSKNKNHKNKKKNKDKKDYKDDINLFKNIKHKKVNFPIKRKSDKSVEPKSHDENSIKRDLKKRIHLTKIDRHYIKLDNNSLISNKSINSNSKRKIVKISRNNKMKESITKEKEKTVNKDNQLDDFELDDLEYLDAIELDKRQFSQIYWARLKRNQIILFTFFSWNDFNITYIKFARFIFVFCTDMAVNVFFFTDDSMHKIYLNYGKYDFIQQIPQVIYSTIISQLIEVFLSYLSYTDKHIYYIKKIKNQKMNKVAIFQTLKCIKIKLIGFFIFTFVFFIFYWYIISCFCAVYENTQDIFIKDSISTFFTGMVYPFIIYLIPSVLRLIALKDIQKRYKFIYKLSDFIPIF